MWTTIYNFSKKQLFSIKRVPFNKPWDLTCLSTNYHPFFNHVIIDVVCFLRWASKLQYNILSNAIYSKNRNTSFSVLQASSKTYRRIFSVIFVNNWFLNQLITFLFCDAINANVINSCGLQVFMKPSFLENRNLNWQRKNNEEEQCLCNKLFTGNTALWLIFSKCA